MFDQLLFPTDGSDGASAAFEHVLDVAAAHDATVHVLNVVDTAGDALRRIDAGVVDDLERQGEQLVSETAAAAETRDLDTETVVVRGTPYERIVDYANAEGIDLIAMATHGLRGLERFLLGSTTERVVRRADVPVLTIRPDEDARIAHPYRNVLLPTDGSDCSAEAVRTGIGVVTGDDAAFHLLSVIDTMALGADVRTEMQMESLEESANQILEDSTAVAADSGVDSPTTAVEYGSSIPNTILTGGSIVRPYGRGDLRIVQTLGVDYGADLETAMDRIEAAAVRVESVRTDPAPEVFVDDFGDTAAAIRVQYWIADPDRRDAVAVRSRVALAIKRSLDAAGIEFSPPSEHELEGNLTVDRRSDSAG